MSSWLPDDRSSGSQRSEQPAPALSDPRAWDRWIEAIGPPAMLLLIAERMSVDLRSQLSAEDIWQEALLRAWRNRERFEWRGTASFRRWLLEIAEGCIWDAADRANALKRGGGAATVTFERSTTDGSSSPDFPFALVASTTPSRIAAHREHSQAMRDALAELPGDLREIVWLRLFEDLSCEEVAARLELGVSAVKHRFRKAGMLYRQKLQHLLSSRAASRSPD